jgi:hypothetical protein
MVRRRITEHGNKLPHMYFIHFTGWPRAGTLQVMQSNISMLLKVLGYITGWSDDKPKQFEFTLPDGVRAFHISESAVNISDPLSH